MDRPNQPNRQSRRRFTVTSVAGTVAGAAALTMGAAPHTAFAVQEASEAPDVATETILDLSSLDGFVTGAAREFYLSASSLGDLFASNAVAVLAAGLQFENEEIASAALTDLRRAVPEALEGAMGSPASGTKRSAAGDLGDENLGLVLTFPFPPERESNEVDAGVTIIRKGADIQVIVSVAYEEALEEALALAESLDGRWPSEDLFDLVPTVEDVPAPLVLRAEAEF